MDFALRTAGCPTAERNLLTEPTGGAAPVSVPLGAGSPHAQLRQPSRAVLWKRRRQVRDEILGRDRRLSQSSSRKGRRRTLNSCLVQPPVDAKIPNRSLAHVSRSSSAKRFTKNWNHSVRSGVRPLDFRTDTPHSGHAINKERGRGTLAVLFVYQECWRCATARVGTGAWTRFESARFRV